MACTTDRIMKVHRVLHNFIFQAYPHIHINKLPLIFPCSVIAAEAITDTTILFKRQRISIGNTR